jgi:hypothetical protein
VRLVLALLTCSACSFAPAPVSGTDGTADAPAGTVDAAPPPADATQTQKTWVKLETIVVPCIQQSAASTSTLANGVSYRLASTGQCVTSSSGHADAEYIYNSSLSQLYDVYQNIDFGIAVDDTTAGMTKTPHWGAFAMNHQYETMWTGSGATITLSFHAGDYSNNSGTISVDLLAYQ